MKAEFIRSITEGFKGNAALYRAGEEFMILSAVNVPYSGDEVMAFAADSEGNLTNSYHDLSSLRGSLSHEELLSEMGYEC
mgnify:FL=1